MSDIVAISRRLDEIELMLERLRKTDLGGVALAFTPTYDGATPGTTTYTTQVGNYMQIGRLIIAQATLVWTNATGTGAVRLGGLPFAAAAGMIFAFPVQSTNVTFANGSIQGFLQGGNAVAQLISPATNAAGTELTVEVAGTLRFTVAYFI